MTTQDNPPCVKCARHRSYYDEVLGIKGFEHHFCWIPNDKLPADPITGGPYPGTRSQDCRLVRDTALCEFEPRWYERLRGWFR